MRVIIVGGGKTLYFLCRSFTAKGHHVSIISPDREECVQLARQLPATVIHGDGSDSGILKEAGSLDADALLAITQNDHDNLVICQLGSLKFGIPKILALANDPDNTEVFEKLGVASFSTANIVGSLIEQRAAMEQITNLLPVSDGRVIVTEILVAENSPITGRLLKDADLPGNALIAVIVRDNKPIIPSGTDHVLAGDRIVLITLPENHGPTLKMFTDETD
ncbi:MAG: NAD-binding protein [Candidatus Aminicenantes bacterium]|nr:NAD-binding protein [Candidatus Aminicenantes bacterium]